MSDTLSRVQRLVATRDYRVSDHAFSEHPEQRIDFQGLVTTIESAIVVEDYPEFPKGPCVLVLQDDGNGPVHVVWGIPKGQDRPAVVVTAYRPDPKRWTPDLRRRRP